jgi:protein TonB
MLLAAFGRVQIRPNIRTFFTPLHMVDLVEKKPGPGAARAAPPKPPPQTKSKKTEPKPPVSVKKTPQSKPTTSTKVDSTVDTPRVPPTKSEPEEQYSEEQVAQRIDQLRQKLKAARPEPGAPEGGEQAVRRKIEAIRKGLGSNGGGGSHKPSGASSGGGGSNALQEVRLRAYYSRLWEHVDEHWAVPPSLEGQPYTVVVSVVIDRQGRLLKSWVEDHSGSDAFDQSALNALARAEPLPAIPETLPDETLEVGFRFHGE